MHLFVKCWTSASARWNKARHCLFLRMSGCIPLTTGSMKVGVDRMHLDISRILLFRAASSRCVWERQHHTGEEYSAGAKVSAVVDVWSKLRSTSICATHFVLANPRSRLHRALTFIIDGVCLRTVVANE